MCYWGNKAVDSRFVDTFIIIWTAMTTRVPAMLTNLHITYIDIPVPFDLGEGISHLCPGLR